MPTYLLQNMMKRRGSTVFYPLITLGSKWYALFFFVSVSSCSQKEGHIEDKVSGVYTPLSNKTSETALIHYWDSFNFKDTSAIYNPDYAEQALVDYIAGFPKVADGVRASAVKRMLSKAKPYPASLQFFSQQYERYLYDPNSPMRNDVCFRPVLEFLLDSCQLSSVDRQRYKHLLHLVKRNNVGTPAIDFEFKLPKGNRKKLSGVDAPFVLLFFYEPGCPHCESAISELRNTLRFRQLVNSGVLNILMIYAFGQSKVWEAYQSKIPSSWENGFDSDKQILNKSLYDLKASPTIYLLDKDKTVLLKDADLSQVALHFNFQI